MGATCGINTLHNLAPGRARGAGRAFVMHLPGEASPATSRAASPSALCSLIAPTGPTTHSPCPLALKGSCIDTRGLRGTRALVCPDLAQPGQWRPWEVAYNPCPHTPELQDSACLPTDLSCTGAHSLSWWVKHSPGAGLYCPQCDLGQAGALPALSSSSATREW